MSLQKKCLEHVSKTLDSFESHKIRQALYDIMSERGIDHKLQSDILNEFQEAMSKENHKIIEAKDWIKSLIENEKLNE